MRYLVIPDVHGRHDLLGRLLNKAGIPESPIVRLKEGVQVVQLGDLANCVEESIAADTKILGDATRLLDTVLVGNHEWPYFGGSRFNGFHGDPNVEHGVMRLHRSRIMRSHLLIGDALLSHAGVSAEWNIATAEEAAGEISHAWKYENRGTSKLLHQIGPSRQGLSNFTAVLMGLPSFGGILWSDWSEPRAAFKQIHGHTPQDKGPVTVGLVTNLDVGCGKFVDRLIGVWVDEHGDLVPDGLVST